MNQSQPHEPICGAKTRNGTPCKRKPMENGRCKHHGGMTPKGMASPHWKTGARSKYNLKGKLATYYEQGLNDPERLSLEAERTLLFSRIQQLLERVDTGESLDRWKLLREYWRDFKAAQRAKDTEQITIAYNEVDRLIGAAWADYAAWLELQRVLGQYKGVVESERKRQIELGQMVALTQNMQLMQLIGELIVQNVEDASARNRIAEGLITIFGVSSVSKLSSPADNAE